MMEIEAPTGNFLHKGGTASLAVVTVDSRGKPDSISYWKDDRKPETRPDKSAYEPGILLDIWI